MRSTDGRFVLGAAIAVGLVLRAAVLWHTPSLGTEIVDEQHYATLAGSLLAGDGFAWAPGNPTSIRPPLYPALVAAIWAVAGIGNLQAVRIVQIALALLTVPLVYAIGRRLFSPAVGRYAAAVTWLYPSLVFFNFTLLTETLYTFLLIGFLLLAVMLLDTPRMATAALCGIVLGLACLTRSVLWPLPLVLCPLLVFMVGGSIRTRLAIPAVLLAGYVAVVLPWAVRNTRLQGVVTIVDTMGGLNLHMGNYEHTPDDRMWDAVSLTGEKHWAYALVTQHPGRRFTEGEKEKWAQRQAIAYIVSHPGTSLRRAAIKLSDFWGLEREFAAGVSQGMYTPPRWFGAVVPFLIIAAYAGVTLLGAAGMWLAAPVDWRGHVLLLLPVVGITAAHAIVFGHSRYHLPLVPIIALYGAAWSRAWLARPREVLVPRRLIPAAGAVASIAALLLIWGRQIVLVDAERIRALFAHVR